MSPTSAPRPVALVTGPTAGIGLEFARQLAASGHDLVLVARNETRLNEVALQLHQDHGAHCEVLVADLADREQLAQVEARLADPAGPIDLLVNNAGFGLKERFLVNSVEQEQMLLDVLVTAVMRLSHAALGPMSERGSGAILNVSSVADFMPRGTYSAAKAYVTRFSEWAHNEYGPAGVQVMALCPGFIRTEFHERMEVGQDTVPSYLWLESPDLVTAALADLAAGKAISVPSLRYKAIVAGAKYVPTGLLQRLQKLGRD
ncbi:SDR family NAD(P)-dependent oxidoreductase [Nocardioides marmorisolisilvae]|uniref:SDR family NAD(P)-dependent oxidoreductase n=1 Tax=Nocardioides marmorisolisilvae TaxID=1542737 RepID=A0A3N0DNX3_9ACTN|nr:SDR family NAD(P)-dependent oxidoreductase [Nocardioides marmorisolisilvae]RNL77338.1 SDR family NAD(P)-dependent oxidoreductase [Nocardioides marmorisolisilvae]